MSNPAARCRSMVFSSRSGTVPPHGSVKASTENDLLRGSSLTAAAVKVVTTLFVVSVPVVGWAIEAGVALTPSHILGFALMALAVSAWVEQRRPLPLDFPTFATAAFVSIAALTVLRVHLEPDLRLLGESLHGKALKQLAGLVFATGVFTALLCLLRWY